MDRSNVRKYVLKQGIHPVTMRTASSRGQRTLALTAEDAEELRKRRLTQGYGPGGILVPALPDDSGLFYVLALVPELSKERIKVGFALSLGSRLESHRTVAPTAAIVSTWPCRRSWESAAIASITREGCTLLGGEVYDCHDLSALIVRGESFFAQLPDVGYLFTEDPYGTIVE